MYILGKCINVNIWNSKNQDTPREVSSDSVAYDDFEGQENTLFIFTAIFDNTLSSHKISEIGMFWFFVIFKLQNQNNTDKIRTAGRYGNVQTLNIQSHSCEASYNYTTELNYKYRSGFREACPIPLYTWENIAKSTNIFS